MVNLETFKSLKLVGKLALHSDWSMLGDNDAVAVTLLAHGRYQDIIDRGLAINLPDDSFFDGLLDDALAAFDNHADSVGFEL